MKLLVITVPNGLFQALNSTRRSLEHFIVYAAENLSIARKRNMNPVVVGRVSFAPLMPMLSSCSRIIPTAWNVPKFYVQIVVPISGMFFLMVPNLQDCVIA